MRQQFLFHLCFILFSVLAEAQNTIPLPNDCDKIVNINLTKVTNYRLPFVPSGFGEKQEIKNPKGMPLAEKHFFEKEHNSSWHSFIAPFDGDLVFEIRPDSTKDDYDFMLFKYSGNTFCDDLQKNKIQPIRSNLSRNNKELKSVTGLSVDSKEEFVGEGPGNSFSKYITVKRGEKYILILDNVYDGGGGFSIIISYKKQVEISGTVLDENAKPLKAEVTIEDSNGNTIARILSDEKTGNYSVSTYVTETVNYLVTIYNDTSFVHTYLINSQNKETYQKINSKLPRLKKDESYTLGNINFYGDQAVMVPSSYPVVKALQKLMNRNEKLSIRIDGHTNGCSQGVEYSQKLSDDRAKAIEKFLLDAGIDQGRISTKGFNCSKMIYPNAFNEFEMAQNRRVEITITSLK